MLETPECADVGDLPHGYKMTELGVLPEDWRVVSLGDVLERVQNGLTRQQDREPVGLAVTRIETIADETINPARVRYVAEVTEGEREKYSLRTGDILFSHINSEPHIGKCALYLGTPPDLLHGMNLLMLRVRPELCDPRYLNFLFKHLRARGVFASLAARAVGQASINQGKLRALEIPLPLLPEQRAIAQVLSTVQRAKEATEAVIAATTELKKSLMRHLFTCGPVPAVEAERVVLRETDIGPVPVHWQVVPMGDLCLLLQYGTSERSESESAGSPVLRIPNVLTGKISTNDLKYACLSPETEERLRLRDGDILFVRTNGAKEEIGRAAVFRGEPCGALFASYLIRVRVDTARILPEYTEAYAASDGGRGQLKGRASKAADGKYNINTQTLRALCVPLPPTQEQSMIVSTLANVDRKLRAEVNRRLALGTLFQSLLEQLMDGSLRTLSQPGRDD
jgi:type I restriction enzyme, S subunit